MFAWVQLFAIVYQQMTKVVSSNKELIEIAITLMPPSNSLNNILLSELSEGPEYENMLVNFKFWFFGTSEAR